MGADQRVMGPRTSINLSCTLREHPSKQSAPIRRVWKERIAAPRGISTTGTARAGIDAARRTVAERNNIDVVVVKPSILEPRPADIVYRPGSRRGHPSGLRTRVMTGEISMHLHQHV